MFVSGPTYKGHALDATRNANLMYLGEKLSAYKQMYTLEDRGNGPKLKHKKEPLVDFLRALDAANDKESLQKLVNLDQTELQLAMNYLAGAWDGVWHAANNFLLNQDLESNQWNVISYDFDETFGNDILTTDAADVPYEEFTPDGAQRPLVSKILAYDKAHFEEILRTLVKRFFKPSVLNPRIEAWRKMLEKDVEWDRALPGRSPGEPVVWNMRDFRAATTKSQGSNDNKTTAAEAAYAGYGVSLSIPDWIERRSASVCKLLNISDTDDIKPIGPYNGGRVLDISGQVMDRASGKAVDPSQQPLPSSPSAQSPVSSPVNIAPSTPSPTDNIALTGAALQFSGATKVSSAAIGSLVALASISASIALLA